MRRQHKPGMTRQGVRDLDHHLGEWVEQMTDPQSQGQEPISDLLYCRLDQEDKDQVLALWPDAVFEPSWDEIHEYRTRVELPVASRLSWYRLLVRSGLADLSLGFQLSLRTELPLVEAAMDAEAPNWRRGV